MIKRFDIKKHISFNLGGLISLGLFVYIIYKMLLQDDILPCSIASVQVFMNHWLKHWHILIVGLLPIYIAFVFFSAAVVGFLFGSALQRCLQSFLIRKKRNIL